ncbi:hypothetical protein IAI58_08655 [Roseomonas marmotae]|uniref:Uncharacterized protein n=2 Tax=Roseomonas marmotae TaxID=2768161 RepID=A0ABS3KB63_9PROT|nr:hypothetical protein [Roseomonas marmotae]MBO1074710.1 hypothetical protein [Roseomonas marmotae]QTI80895.1 hypothetical protein IAI58_08655 [Roseomonas marmotae]
MGALIVVATVALVVLLIQRMGEAAQGVAVANTEMVLTQPAGSRIAGIAALNGQLAVWVERPDGGRVLLLDPRNLRQTGELRLGQ